MQRCHLTKIALVSALLSASVVPAQAQIRITEVAPWSSGNSPIAADWFELTNFGPTTVSISGWKFDDSSNSFGASVVLNGVTGILPGESVIFVESATSPSAAFKSLWFGATVPAGLQIGNYSGSGIGLSTAGDAVNVYNDSGSLQANVTFGASPPGPFSTFDNAAGLNGTTISQLSAVGTNGAFKAASDLSEIGSPGQIAAVPEPETYAMMLAGLGLVGLMMGRRRVVGGAFVV